MRNFATIFVATLLFALWVIPAQAGLVLHSTMDNGDVHRGATYPPPNLDTSGGTFTIDDSAGTEQDGTAQNNMSSGSTGVIGQALNKYSVTNYGASYGNVHNYNPSTGITVSIWVRPASGSTNENRIFVEDGADSSNNTGWTMKVDNTPDKPEFLAQKTGTFYGVQWEGGWAHSTWYNMVMVIDPDAVETGDTGRLIGYMNGEGSGTDGEGGNWTKEGGGNSFAGTTDFSVNASTLLGNRQSPHNNNGFSGLYDDFAIWDEALTVGEARSLFTLADESALNYNAGHADSLWDVYDNGGTVTIGSLTWQQYSDMTGAAGDVVDLGAGNWGLILNDSGGGVSTIPEPSTFALAALGLLGLMFFRRRRR